MPQCKHSLTSYGSGNKIRIKLVKYALMFSTCARYFDVPSTIPIEIELIKEHVIRAASLSVSTADLNLTRVPTNPCTHGYSFVFTVYFYFYATSFCVCFHSNRWKVGMLILKHWNIALITKMQTTNQSRELPEKTPLDPYQVHLSMYFEDMV